MICYMSETALKKHNINYKHIVKNNVDGSKYLKGCRLISTAIFFTYCDENTITIITIQNERN